MYSPYPVAPEADDQVKVGVLSLSVVPGLEVDPGDIGVGAEGTGASIWK